MHGCMERCMGHEIKMTADGRPLKMNRGWRSVVASRRAARPPQYVTIDSIRQPGQGQR